MGKPVPKSKKCLLARAWRSPEGRAVSSRMYLPYSVAKRRAHEAVRYAEANGLTYCAVFSPHDKSGMRRQLHRWSLAALLKAQERAVSTYAQAAASVMPHWNYGPDGKHHLA